MRVLLIAANQEHKPDPVVPLGAIQVAASARAAGHAVRLYDACFAGSACHAELAAAVDAFRPEAIGLSLRNVDNVAWPHAVSYLDHYRKLAATARERAPGVPLVLGGSAFTLFPEAFLAALGADYGVVGEGEAAFTGLLADLAAHKRLTRPVDHGPGGDARLIYAPRLALSDAFTEPAYDLVDLDRYLKLGGAVNLQTKRGCAFRCAYCTYPQLEGCAVRPRPPASAVDVMERLWKERGVDSFFVVDNTFNVPADHARAFCDELARRRLNLRWTCYCTPAGFTPDLAAAMARSGCASVELGTDAGASATLAALGKSFTPDEIRAASAACREAGLKTCHSLILGGPGETWETLAETVRVIEECRPTAVVAMLGVRLYRDTDLARRAEAEGMLKREDIGLDPVFYLSETVRDGLEDWARKLVADHPTWFVPGLEGDRRPRTHQRLRQRGVKGPLWEVLPEIGSPTD
jgi:radical SAM superfamily enzyme YgiQ (UPF0313 family)